ncbi:MAG TPA: RDD family protein [Planctomycetota bacterium]|nr:RDD family protein [Planctomycetota bacterium]
MTAAVAAEGKSLERRIVTPEGIPLRIELARAGDRAGGFLLDLLIQAVVMIALILIVGGATDGDEGWGLAFGLLAVFLVRSFYFIWFEIRWQGRTPGKRVVGTRVMDATGGPLRSEAVVVRNLMREIEVWLPITFLFFPQLVWPDAPGWARLLFSVWAFVFLLMPLFNRSRLRVGDMVAGTIVVVAPRAVLLPDLGETASEATCTFTNEQLSVYGIYELQVLEDLLRRTDPGRRDACAAVEKQIRRKIGFEGDVKTDRFLREFYRELRAHLERRMLLGKRKKDKHSR